MEKIKFEGYNISKRGNSWHLYIGTGLTGKPIRQSLNTYDKDVAIRRAREIYSELQAEYDTGMGKHSFQVNAEDFIATTNNPQHREYMNRCFIPYFGDKIGNKAKIKDINKLTNLDLIKYVEYRRTIMSSKTNKPVKPTTIIRENNTLRSFFNWCYTTGRISKQLKLPTIRSKENIYDENGNPVFEDLSGKRNAFTSEEVEKIFTTLLQEIKKEVNRHTKRRKLLLYYYISILYETGIRPVELRNLTWSHYQASFGEGGLFNEVYSRKQNNKRSIALSPRIVKMLNKLKARQKHFCELHDIEFNEDEINIISICNSNNETKHYEIKAVRELDNGFRRLLDRCNIAHTNTKVLYSYRHSYISALVQNETPTINIAKQCGTSVKMIEQYYDQSSHLANMSQLFLPARVQTA